VFNLTTIGTPSRSAAEPGVPGAAQPGSAAAAGAGSQAAPEGQLDAAGFARRGSASASRRDYEHAIADLTKAIELDPTQADFFYQRGTAYGADNQPDKALEDLSQAIKLKPDDLPALLARAELHARRSDPAELVTADLDAADRAAPKQADMRLTLGGLYEHAGNYSAAIAQYDDWIDARNSDDVQMPGARNARCRARALAGRELDKALDDCSFAVRKRSKVASFLDSRGLVYLRLGKYAKAIGDYDAALALDSKIAWSLYGRGLDELRKGETAPGQADIKAATAINPHLPDEAKAAGLTETP